MAAGNRAFAADMNRKAPPAALPITVPGPVAPVIIGETIPHEKEASFSERFVFDVYGGAAFGGLGRGGIAAGSPDGISSGALSGHIGGGVSYKFDDIWALRVGAQINTGASISSSEASTFTYCNLNCGGVYGQRPATKNESIKDFPSFDLKAGVRYALDQNWTLGFDAGARFGTVQGTSAYDVPAYGPLAGFKAYDADASGFTVRPLVEANATYTWENGMFAQGAVGHVFDKSVSGTSFNGETYGAVRLGYAFGGPAKDRK